MTHRPIADIASNLEDATRQLKDAATKADNARRDETAALNLVNSCQKEMEAAMVELRNSAPRNTEWANRDNKVRT